MPNQEPRLYVGEIVRTSYGSGPYTITEIDGPCTCRSFHDDLDDEHSAGSQPHYHLTCTQKGKKGSYYLNGYRHDGSNVWDDDYLIFPFRSQNNVVL